MIVSIWLLLLVIGIMLLYICGVFLLNYFRKFVVYVILFCVFVSGLLFFRVMRMFIFFRFWIMRLCYLCRRCDCFWVVVVWKNLKVFYVVCIVSFVLFLENLGYVLIICVVVGFIEKSLVFELVLVVRMD